MRPRLLDLYCRAGGAAMGYHRAGFEEVVGVDCQPQKRYPFAFVQADALEYLAAHGHEFDAIHASPPCQRFCRLASLYQHRPDWQARHPDLLEPTRVALAATGKPYVIENVPGAPLVAPILLCGTMFGLGTRCGAELRRHRLFETNWLCLAPEPCYHPSGARVIGVYGRGCPQEGRRTISVHGRPQMRETISVIGSNPEGKVSVISVTGSTNQQNVVRNLLRRTYTVQDGRDAMGIDWMVQSELSQAVPPAYTEFIGRQLREVLR